MPRPRRGAAADSKLGVVRRDRILLALAFVAGCVDALSYLGLSRVFTANMTGNAVLLGLAIGQTQELQVAHSSAAIVGFVLGVVVAEFFGSINWLRGKMLDANHVETECGVLCVADSRRCDGAVIVGIRPEDVRFERSSNDDENRIEGKVMSSTFLGDQVVGVVGVFTEITLDPVDLAAEIGVGGAVVVADRGAGLRAPAEVGEVDAPRQPDSHGVARLQQP